MQSLSQKSWIQVASSVSVEGLPIAFFLSEPGYVGPIDTLILGAFHGDEHESELLTTQFLSLVSPEVFGERVVGVVPIVNPDGVAKDQRVNASLVDLNRNFPTQDWESQGEGSPYYSGPSAASEPETRFLLMLLEKYPPQKIVSVHTPYKVLNFDGPGEPLAQEMSKINGYPVVADIGYATPGSFGTYVGKERNIATVTLELPEGEAFTDADFEKNLLALKAAVMFGSGE